MVDELTKQTVTDPNTIPTTLIPITIAHNRVVNGSLFQVSGSLDSLPKNLDSPPQEANHYSEFYLNISNPTPLEQLAIMAGRNTLGITCSITHNKMNNTATAYWSFHTDSTVYAHHSPNLTNCSRYRASLVSIFCALMLLHQVEEQQEYTPSHISILSSHKKAHRQEFNHCPAGITTVTERDYDLILEIHTCNPNCSLT